jgi:AcrR family transcriptional regulator
MAAKKDNSERIRTQLDRNDWIQAATDILAEHGINGIRVEVLAKTFGVTKGSFYWHFKDRQELLSSVLQTWKEGRVNDIAKQTAISPGDEKAAALKLIEVYSSNRNRKGLQIELAMRDWARHDPETARAVEEVDNVRLANACKVLSAVGLPEREAKARSLLLYAYVFGQSLMFYDSFDANVPDLKQRVAEHIAFR